MITEATQQLKRVKKQIDDDITNLNVNKIISRFDKTGEMKLSEQLKYLDAKLKEEVFELIGTINQVKFSIAKLLAVATTEEQLDIIKQMESELFKVQHIEL